MNKIKEEQEELFDRENAQGSVYDKMYFTDDQLKQGAEINKKAAAGEISWDSAHNWWEDARAGYGYTGGEDGHGFTKIGSKETAPTYTSNYQNAMNQAANALLNRKAFTYDPNTDPMYQQYADSYTRQGKQAMDDTLAQVSARTGGLASSYAGTAAQQTYNNYMSALADKVPELRQLAYQMYLGEEDSARNKFDVLSKLEDAEYGRYIDRWNQWNADRQYDYNKSRDELAQKNYLNEVAYKKERDEIADQLYKDEKAEESQMLAAQMMAQAGDFSGYKNLLNLTDEQVSTLTGNYDSAKALTVAEMMAQTGDFSGYKSIFNLTDEQVARLEKWYANQNAPKVTGSGTVKSEWETFKKSPGYNGYMEKIESFTNQEDLSNYLQKMIDNGYVSDDLAWDLFNAYAPEAVSPTTDELWTVVDDGGRNWFWGIDNNAEVQDRSGTTYTLKELREKLISEGMSKKEADAYVKKIQQDLGI